MSTADFERNSQQRVDRIIRRARHEVGARDVAVFAMSRAWSVLLIVGAGFYVLADKWARGGVDAVEGGNRSQDV